MPTHDFEKQVQQKMDELKFTPSDAVWQELAKQLEPPKKKRRLLVWWWLLPLVGAGFGVYFIGYRNAPDKNNTAAPPAVAISKYSNNISQLHIRKVAGTPVIAASKDVYSSAVDCPRKSKTGKPSILPGNAATAVSTAATVSEQTTLHGSWPALPSARFFAIGPVPPPATGGQFIPVPLVGPLIGVAAPAHKPQSKKKLQWVITAGVGQSAVSSGFSLPKSSPAYNYDYRGSGSLTGISGNPPFNNSSSSTIYGPSAVHNAASFRLGAALRRDIGHGFSVEAGVQYSYYSTTIDIGSKVDSARAVVSQSLNVSSYYQNKGTLESYTNQYHFIELPLRVQKQLGRWPVSVNTGLTIGRFIGSNALQYDVNGNVYYRDNSAFNKTQLDLTGGVDIRLWPNRPVSLELGPNLQYGLSNLFKKDLYGSRHLVAAGLELRLFFGKK